MAYQDPGGYPDDWARFITSGGVEVRPFPQSLLLGGNPVSNFGTYCLKFLSPGSSKGSFYKYIDAPTGDTFYTDAPVSCRMLFRRDNPVTCQTMTAVVNYQSNDLWYGVYETASGLNVSGCVTLSNYSPSATSGVISGVPSFSTDTWNAVQLDASRHGDSMRLTAYYIIGSTACDQMGAGDESVWVKAVDFLHNKYTGIAIIDGYGSLGTDLGTSPSYRGSAGFMVGGGFCSNANSCITGVEVKTS